MSSVSRRTALISIDVQRDFYDPAGSAPIAGTAQCLPAMHVVAASFREVALPIVHVVRLYESDGSNAEPVRRDLVRSKNVVRPYDAGSELAPELLPAKAGSLDPSELLAGQMQALGPAEWIMYKPRWGAFYRTPLEEHLRQRGVDTVVFMGCNFPNCPRTSVYEASERDYNVVLVSDAVSGLYERGARELENIGVRLVSSDRLAAAVLDLAAV